jgi:hypothetical protein
MFMAVVLTAALAGMASAQTLTDIGYATPTPGSNDIYQLSTTGDKESPDGLNYYSNNNNPPGQTFTTGASATTLVSLAILSAGLNNGGDYGDPSGVPDYFLRLYSVSGSTATLLDTYTNANPGFTDGQWLKWTNLSVALAASSKYAYSVSDLPGGSSSWFALAVASGTPYSGGQIVLIPTNGGAMTVGTGYSATFDLGMFANSPTANTPLVSPVGTVYVGQAVTLSEYALGTGTLTYQWQTDGGSGGTLTNIPGSNGTQLVETLPTVGAYKYDIIVTSATYGSATSYAASVTVLPPAAVGINVAETMATMPSQGLGVNSAVYDNYLVNQPQIAPLLKAAGVTAIRYPGGSYADGYNWETSTVIGGYVANDVTFPNFMTEVVNPAGAHAVITVNYGSNPENNGGGSPTFAAGWVGDANVTNNYDITYWEIGNEVYGNGYFSGQDWEYDLHFTNQTASARVGQAALSGGAYGTNALQFISDMKAVDPNIKCGIFVNPDEETTWNQPLLKACGSAADFVIIHWYPGSDVASTLASWDTIVPTINETFTQLTNLLGAAKASQMTLAVTELGAGTTTGAPVSLFAADNFMTFLENGVVNVDYEILHENILENNETPGDAYYGMMLCHLLANIGDSFLACTSAQTDLRIHATKRQDGRIGVMLVNLNPAIGIAATVNISGPTLSGTGIAYRFGLTNYSGANDYPSWPVSTNTVSGLGNTFTILVPAYTIIDLLIPTNTPPVLAALGNQTVNVGQTVTFTASATDTNLPTPTLTFSLLSAPTNATLTPINNTSAAFNWQPLVSQANSTNSISIKVADNGNPPLSATQNFSVFVNPITLPTLTGSTANLANGQFTLVVNGMVGPDYAVRYSTDLVNWTIVFETNSPPAPFIWVDTNASLTNPASFYQVILGPPLP